LCAQKAWSIYQGGSAWAGYGAYITFGRDYLKLQEKGVVSAEQYAKYAHWETLAKLSGFRFMHEDFCIISDRPVEYHVLEDGTPHCETGPFVRWADGTAFYALNGVHVPARWIEHKDEISPAEIIAHEDVEARAAGAAFLGWPRMLEHLQSRTIDDSGSDDIGQLIELTIPGLNEPGRFLKAWCPRNGYIVEGVPYVSDIDNKPINTALAAQAWRVGLTQTEYRHPSVRT